MSRRIAGGERCSACGKGPLDPLLLLEREGIPPDEEGHNIGYSHLALFSCPACGAGEVERRDHDCFDFEEVWDQYEWYVLGKPDVERLRALVAACPHPFDPDCRCALHVSLRKACGDLPRSWWSTALEGRSHVHAVTLVERREGPVLVVAAPR